MRLIFDHLATVDLASLGPWNLMVEWYRAILPNTLEATPRSLFGKELDIEIASKGWKFWDRDAADVIEELVALTGFKIQQNKRPGSTAKIKQAGSAAKRKRPARRADIDKPDDAGTTGLPVDQDSPPESKTRTETKIAPETVGTHSDEPTSLDQLGRRPFAQALVERIESVRKQNGWQGFAVHLHAPGALARHRF